MSFRSILDIFREDNWSNDLVERITRMLDPQTGRERYYLYFIANRDDDEAESDWMDRMGPEVPMSSGISWPSSSSARPCWRS